MCFCVFFSFFLWWENTKTHTICCVFVFFCLKSSWHFLPCVFCVFCVFFLQISFLVLLYLSFLSCACSPRSKILPFFSCFFSFYFLLTFCQHFFLVNFNLFFFKIVYSWIILFFWILSSLPQNFALSYLVFVFLYDALCVVFRWRSSCFLSQHVVSSFPSECNQTKLWNLASKSANYWTISPQRSEGEINIIS